MFANPPPLSAEILSAIRDAIATFRECMAGPDIKLALKAASELAKLVTTCKRVGIEIPSEVEPIAPPAPPIVPNAGSETIRKQKTETLTSVFTPRCHEQNQPPLSRAIDLPLPHSVGGKPLTSFLGGAKPPPPGGTPIRPGSSG